MKAPKPSTYTTKPAGSCCKLPSATPRMVAKATLTMKIASIDQATQVQRLPTAPPRLLRTATAVHGQSAFYTGIVPKALRTT